MKTARLAAILIALSLMFSCELFKEPNGRENPKDPQSPAYVSPVSADWHGVTTVDSTNDVGKYASMKVSAGNVFISYFDAAFLGHTRFANSSDRANTWTTSQVDYSAYTAGNPSAIAIRPNASSFDIALIYQDSDHLHAKKSSDGGVTWADPATLQPDDSTNILLHHCSLAAGTGADDTYYASYYVQGAVGGNLFFAKSSAGGGDWSAGTFVDLNPTEDVGKFNSIAVQGTAVFISYQNITTGKVVMTNSITGGTGWRMPPVFVGNTSATTLGGTAVAATDALNVYVAYFDGTDLAFAKSSDGGGSFPGGGAVCPGGFSPSIAVSGNSIYISHFSAGGGELLFTRSDDLGVTWHEWSAIRSAQVDTGLGVNWEGKSTSIAVDGTDVYIAYYDHSNGDLKIAKSIDNGDTW